MYPKKQLLSKAQGWVREKRRFYQSLLFSIKLTPHKRFFKFNILNIFLFQILFISGSAFSLDGCAAWIPSRPGKNREGRKQANDKSGDGYDEYHLLR